MTSLVVVFFANVKKKCERFCCHTRLTEDWIKTCPIKPVKVTSLWGDASDDWELQTGSSTTQAVSDGIHLSLLWCLIGLWGGLWQVCTVQATGFFSPRDKILCGTSLPWISLGQGKHTSQHYEYQQSVKEQEDGNAVYTYIHAPYVLFISVNPVWKLTKRKQWLAPVVDSCNQHIGDSHHPWKSSVTSHLQFSYRNGLWVGLRIKIV